MRPVRPRRSALYLPASHPRALEKARGLSADVLIFDLEDAVAPEAKDAARDLLARALEAGGFGARERVVRLNGLDTPWFAADLTAVARMPLDAVLLPKIHEAREVLAAIDALDRAGAPATLPVWVMAETARGVLNIQAIAGCSPRLGAIVLGTSDLGKELRLPATPDRLGLLAALSLCVLAARAHGLDVLDGVHVDLEDEAGLQASCEQGRQLGFDGKTLIHPRQLDAANRAFSPGAAELEHARRVIAGWHEALAQGRGVAVVAGKLVEHLHVEEAKRLLTLAEVIARGAG